MPRGPEISDFAEKLRLALSKANLSRAQLAQAVGVDKSVVARWLNGALHPSDHTLTMLTAALGKAVEGFSRADFDLARSDFAVRLGMRTEAAATGAHPSRVPILPGDALNDVAARMGEAIDEADRTYSGLWLFVHPSERDQEGRLRIRASAGRIMRPKAGTLLEVELGALDVVHARGVALVIQGDLHFLMTADRRMDVTILSCAWYGVNFGRALVLDGLVLSRDRLGEMAIATYRGIGFRVSDATDDAAFAAILRRNFELGDLQDHLPASVGAAFTGSDIATAIAARTRLTRTRCWSCHEEFIDDPAASVQREALNMVRALFADALKSAAPA
jgi:transcriptional regulator with XRE-family HTH domain